MRTLPSLGFHRHRHKTFEFENRKFEFSFPLSCFDCVRPFFSRSLLFCVGEFSCRTLGLPRVNALQMLIMGSTTASVPTSSQGTGNLNCYWGMLGSEEPGTGFSSTSLSNGLNSSLNCHQSSSSTGNGPVASSVSSSLGTLSNGPSLDTYNHSAYSTPSTGTSGYPGSYYSVTSGPSPTVAYGASTGVASSASLYQQLAASSSARAQLITSWDTSPDLDECKSKLSKKNCHYSLGETTSPYVHHPFDTSSTKSTFDLLSAHSNPSSIKGNHSNPFR